MVYRNDVEALEARHAELEAQVAERARARDEVAQMLVEARVRQETEHRLADLAAGGPARRRRRALRIAAVAVLLALVGIGAVYRFRPTEEDRIEAAIQQLSRFTDQMCTCTTSGCAQQVNGAMTKWAQTMAKDFDPRPQPDSAQMKRAAEIAERMGKCMMKAMSDAASEPTSEPALIRPDDRPLSRPLIRPDERPYIRPDDRK